MRKKKLKIIDEDYDFVSLCQKGDLDAFEVLVRKHENIMINIAYRMLGNYEEACDIVQDAFLAAYRSIRGFEGRAKFSTWLYKIVVNLSKNRRKQLQKKHNRERFSIDAPAHTDNKQSRAGFASSELSALQKLEQKEIQHQVQGCINDLDDGFREVLILRDIQGFSYTEITEILEIPMGTVKSKLFRARDELKNRLKQTIGDL